MSRDAGHGLAGSLPATAATRTELVLGPLILAPAIAARRFSDSSFLANVGQARRHHRMSTPFAEAFPHLARWVETHGWIEVGNDGMSPSFVRVLDEGGMVWEGGEDEVAVDRALRSADVAVGRWSREQMGE